MTAVSRPRRSVPLWRNAIARIAYYISSHGYGHAARSAAVLSRLARDHRLIIKTLIPETFFSAHLPSGSFRHVAEATDAGCVQKDFITIDIEATWSRFAGQTAGRDGQIEREAAWLRSEGVALAVSDVPSLPLAAARSAGIPGVLIANFTWLDIYSAFPRETLRHDLLEILRREYSLAAVQILPQCHIENSLDIPKEEVGFIGLRGNNIRPELERHLGVSLQGKTVIFIYLGEHDASRVQWRNLTGLDDCLFVTRDPAPAGGNLFVLDSRFAYPDLIASCDVVCTKAGYSTLATAFIHGKPVMTCDREDFCETKAMRTYLARHDIGLFMDDAGFYSADWKKNIKEAAKISVKNKVKVNGDSEAERIIRSLLPRQ